MVTGDYVLLLVLGCLEDLAAEPTNNRAERALRPAVIPQTIMRH